MILKNNLKLRKVGDRYMLVDVSEQNVNLTSVYTFNESAAFLWNTASQHGIDPAALAARLCEEYDVAYEIALSDVNHLLLTWKESGLIL